MRWIAGREDAKHFRFVHYTYEPNWSTNKTHLHHARESAYYILEGSALVHINGEETMIGPGAAVYLSPGDIHGVVGAGPEGLVMLEVWVSDCSMLQYWQQVASILWTEPQRRHPCLAVRKADKKGSSR